MTTARHDIAPQIQTTPFGELSNRDREIIAFERQWWKYAGAKEHTHSHDAQGGL